MKGKSMKSKLLIEQHFHGCFGVSFNTATVDEVLYLAKEIRKYGIGGIFPTLATDSADNIKRQTKIIKTAANRQTPDMAQILGVHLEGIFLNPVKKGAHDEKLFLPLTRENFDLVADDFIKIMTVAPEMGSYTPKGVKLQAGHCVGADLSEVDGVTHIFNAMEGISHRKASTALSALIDDRIYTEVIVDGVHLSDDILKLIFKTKPADKILLVSDSLPIVCSDLDKMSFAGQTVCRNGCLENGTIAGSMMMLPQIVKLLAAKKMFDPQFIENPYIYHKIDLKGEIEWDEEFNIIKC